MNHYLAIKLRISCYADDTKLEEMKSQLPSPESFQFKLNSIDFEKVQRHFYNRFAFCWHVHL